jgi:hypothetical protein
MFSPYVLGHSTPNLRQRDEHYFAFEIRAAPSGMIHSAFMPAMRFRSRAIVSDHALRHRAEEQFLERADGAGLDALRERCIALLDRGQQLLMRFDKE